MRSTLRYKWSCTVDKDNVAVNAPGRKSQDFGAAVARWLRTANQDGRGRERMTLVALAEASGVARTTIYRIRDGAGADQETLSALAKALQMPSPRIVRVLDAEPDQLRPASVLGWITEARAALDRAEILLERSLEPDEDVAGETMRLSAAVERAEAKRPQPRKRGPQSGGSA